MIGTITRLLNRYIFTNDLPLPGRILNMIGAVGLVATVISLIGHHIEGASPLIWAIKLLMLGLLLLMLYCSNRSKRYKLWALLTLFVFVDVLFPMVFIFNGGVQSGVSAYFVLCIVVIVMLSYGKWRIVAFASFFCAVGFCYWLNATHPECIVMLDLQQQYLDSWLAFIISGSFIGLAIGIINRLFINEKKAVEAASHAKSTFLAQMSHEMRTPMNAIIGMTSIAKTTEDPERLRDSIGKIDVASNHLLGVINDILDISKIEAGKLELDQSAFDFYSMIDQTLSVVGFRIDERKIHFVQNLDKSIPRFLKGDGQRISQVITNLLSNAVKFTPERGTVTLETAMAWRAENECSFRVCVRDTGIGISDEQLKRLFNAFEQADNSTSRRFGGTGLGLAISREIIELMGGRIWAESELGQGSSFTFEITLPLSTEREMPLEEPSRFDKESMHGCFRDYHILIAEDIEINREIVLALLEDTGINIDIALNGREEVEMFAANHERYDLIFSDVQMPEMDGYEAVRIIRGMDVPSARTIPIIAMTANVFKEDVLRAREAGMDSHIGKPLVQKDLLSKLVRYLPDVPKSRERDEAMAPSL